MKIPIGDEPIKCVFVCMAMVMVMIIVIFIGQFCPKEERCNNVELYVLVAKRVH